MNKFKNLTNLLYSGNVAIRFKIGDKIVSISNHNSGLPALQRSFCNYITGNRTTTADIPQFIDVRCSLTDGGTYETILLNKLPITGKSWDEGKYTPSGSTETVDTYVAKFTSVLSSNSLANKVSKGDGKYYRLYLISGSPTTSYDLAYIDISSELLSMVGPGTQAIIEWSLQLIV